MRNLQEIDKEIEGTSKEMGETKEKLKKLDKKLNALLQEKTKTVEKLLEGKM